MASSSPSSAAALAREALAVEGLAYAWPGRAQPDLEGVDLRVAAGECVFLAGASGAGKTTLLRAIAGVLPRAGRTAGSVRVAGGRPALLLQPLDTQLLCTRVDEEVRFGLELRGTPAAECARRARAALAALGLADFAPRAVDDLSAGEKQRVLLAALLALEPGLLLLDEPASQLDHAGRAVLVSSLGELKRRGHAIVVADHLFEPFAALVDRRVTLKEGRLAPGEAPAPLGRAAPPPPPRGGAPALEVADLHVAGAGSRPVLAGLSLVLAPGERVHVMGDNGAGKSTLLRVAAGLLRPAGGRVRVGGVEPPGVVGRVALLFQSPERNLFEPSVADEVAFTPRRAGLGGARLEARVARLLERCGLSHLRERSPLRLSFGEQHRVALASVLAPRPDLLLLDEPFSGLDAESRGRVLELLDAEQREAGFAVLIASHDRLPIAGWAHRELVLREGGLHPARGDDRHA